MSVTYPKVIDIEKIIKQKAGSKAKLIPNFAFSWFRKLIHENQLNECIAVNKGKTGVDWLKGCLDYLDVQFKISGEENFPPNDGKCYTFVSNHPLGGADGVGLGAIIGERYNNNICYLLNDLLCNIPQLESISVPINKTGTQSRNFPQMVDAGFKSNKQILIFPAGLCSRKKKGKIADLSWKPTFISKSIQNKRDIVPIYFGGSNSNRFYRIANISAALHSKFNFAMIFLVDEMFRNCHKTFEVKIGKPIPWTSLTQERSKNDWAQYIREIVYKL